MFGSCSLILGFSVVLSLNVISNQAAGVRFPGAVLQRQEVAPYPAAGLMPDPPFDLPTEQVAEFPQPDLTYGAPEEQPDLTYGPPDEVYGPPDEVYGPPDEAYGPPDNTYGPPETEALPEQTYGPAEANIDVNSVPQNAATISLASLRPQAQLLLPLIQRFTTFRQVLRPGQTQRKPAQLTVRPQRRPANIINGFNMAFPNTQFTLPFLERRIPFRAQRLVLNAPLKRKPARLTVNSSPANIAQLTPSIRKPIISGGRIIGFSDRAQNW